MRRRAPEKFSQKLVILGFDGMDPHLVERWMDEGKLPNMHEAREAGGGIYPLGTTHSPESPTAWASFATGVNAGKHNIYDFLVRDTSTYLPDLGMVTRTPPKFLFNYFPISRPKRRIDARRHVVLGHGRPGRRAIRHADGAGDVSARRRPERRAVVGPAAARHPRHDGHVFLLRDRLSRYEEGNTEMGGILKRLVFEGDTRHDRARRTAEPDRPAAARGDPRAKRRR